MAASISILVVLAIVLLVVVIFAVILAARKRNENALPGAQQAQPWQEQARQPDPDLTGKPTVHCGACGMLNLQTNRFCTRCGKPIRVIAADPPGRNTPLPPPGSSKAS